MIDQFLSAIYNTSFWNFFVIFAHRGHKDVPGLILVNFENVNLRWFWGYLNTSQKIDPLWKPKLSQQRSNFYPIFGFGQFDSACDILKGELQAIECQSATFLTYLWRIEGYLASSFGLKNQHRVVYKIYFAFLNLAPLSHLLGWFFKG